MQISSVIYPGRPAGRQERVDGRERREGVRVASSQPRSCTGRRVSARFPPLQLKT